jgi:hypothetical protein
MATRSDLRARLQRRLGLGVVASLEQERLNEALNAGIARALSDGVPGLATYTMTGGVLGQLALTSVTITQYDQSVTIAGADAQADHVHPHDILVVSTDAGETYSFLIQDAYDATTLRLGIPANQSISGNTSSYIVRRSLDLPSTGQVVSVYPVGTGPSDTLARESSIAFRDPYRTGNPRFFEQHFSRLHNESSVSLWPAPTDTTKQWVVHQAQFKVRLTGDSETLDFPEEVLDAVLERARNCYLIWTGAANQNDLAASSSALRDTSDALKNSSNPQQIFYKT